MHDNNFNRKKLIRITTVPMALRYLLPGQMNYMQENGFEVVMISAEGKELDEVIANEKCRHIVVPMTRKITPLQDLKCLFQLIRIFRKEKPDIIHSHTPKAGLLGMVAGKLCGVKVRIHTVAGLPMMVEKGFKFRLLKFIERITYAAANNVWPNSGSLLQYINKNKLTTPQKLSIIAKGSTNGINTDKFDRDALDENILAEIKQQTNYDKRNTYLLCMGRLVKDKGIVELVNVFTALQKSTPTLRLILVGDTEASLDPLPAETLASIKENKAIIHVEWTKHVAYFMRLADTFIFPSHREGFPNVLLQAGAMQLPIICSRICGNIDLVENEETGLVFDMGDEQQMKASILKAVSQKDKMLLMAMRLKEKIRADYRHGFIWQTILQKYILMESAAPAAHFNSLRNISMRINLLRQQLIAEIQHAVYGLQGKGLAKNK